MIYLPVVGNYADIDVYASILAYTDLLNQCGKPTKSYIPITPNYSVPESLRLSKYEGREFDLQLDDTVIILDVSIPDVIHKFVSDDQILEIIDHHSGYEEYWQKAIGGKAIIEPIGAVATLVFEWWGERWDYAKMSPEIAKLLLAAILDNMLNFTANITTERDRATAERLAGLLGTMVEDFAKWYFAEVNRTIIANLDKVLTEDHKTITGPLGEDDLEMVQLTTWNAGQLLAERARIIAAMNESFPSWFVNIISISEKRNYILVSSPELATYFADLLGLESQDGWLVSPQVYLRKEIIGKILKQREK